jgi:ubiquinone/menaquinone biosynthesis C-methylase UbiE
MSERYESEREFHNRAFSEDVRSSVGKFYSVIRSSRAFYERFLAERAPGARALEYGCGPGSYAFFLARQGAQVTGIDISETAIEQARAQARDEQLEIEFRVMNAERLEFPDDSFDLICGTGVVHHLDLRAAFAELARTMKPAGAAAFVEPLGHNPLINLYRSRTPGLRTQDEHPLLLRDLDLARSYFRVVEPHFFHLASLAAVPFREQRWFGRLLGTLDAADRALFRLPPLRRFAWQVVIVLSDPDKHRPDR